MLRKMEARGLVRHRLHERKFLYRAAVRAEEVTRKISSHFLDRLFEGSLADMLAHLLTTREVSLEELARLEKLIAERKQQP
jgi:predicted transcriptional regulator